MFLDSVSSHCPCGCSWVSLPCPARHVVGVLVQMAPRDLFVAAEASLIHSGGGWSHEKLWCNGLRQVRWEGGVQTSKADLGKSHVTMDRCFLCLRDTLRRWSSVSRSAAATPL